MQDSPKDRGGGGVEPHSIQFNSIQTLDAPPRSAGEGGQLGDEGTSGQGFAPYSAAAVFTFEDAFAAALFALDNEGECFVEELLDLLRLSMISIGAPIFMNRCSSLLSSSRKTRSADKKEKPTFLEVRVFFCLSLKWLFGCSCLLPPHSLTLLPLPLFFPLLVLCRVRALALSLQATTADDEKLRKNGWGEVCYDQCTAHSSEPNAPETPTPVQTPVGKKKVAAVEVGATGTLLSPVVVVASSALQQPRDMNAARGPLDQKYECESQAHVKSQV
jgi:hypothetical protein